MPKTTRDPLLANKDLSLCLDYEKKVYPNHSKSMVLEPFLFPTQKSHSTKDMEETDIQEINNPQYVPHYAKEIFVYLRSIEVKLLSKKLIN